MHPSHLSSAWGSCCMLSPYLFFKRDFESILTVILNLRNSNFLRAGPSQSQHKHRLSKILANITFLHPVRVLRKKVWILENTKVSCNFDSIINTMRHSIIIYV